MKKSALFIDFSGDSVLRLADDGVLEATPKEGDPARLEISRWGLIAHGIGQETCKFLIHLDNVPNASMIAGTMNVTLSFRAISGNPEIRVDYGSVKPWMSIKRQGDIWNTTVDVSSAGKTIKVLMRSQPPGEVVFYYLSM